MDHNHKSDGEQVIVSLTSYPAAIGFAAPAIKSILEGSVLPDKIVLYLLFSQFKEGEIPEELFTLEKQTPIFEIRDCERDLRSYLKLVPALKDFPDSVIVTIDDDEYYHKNFLKDLLKIHRIFPNDIIAHRVKKIDLNSPYSKWKKYKWHNFFLKRHHPRYKNLQTGVGGVLYPPHSLKKDMMDPDLFTKLAPTTDDFWFWAAAVANGRKIVPVPFGVSAPHGIGKPAALSLMTVNYTSGVDRNIQSLNTILDRYPEIRHKIENE
ncbi:MAG: glycosyltransferase [Bacteroides sp.]|nr:glycosyltransferase [Bacteroides sp.]